MDSIFNQNFPKVDHQSEPEVHEPEVGKELCFEERVVLLSSLALDNHFLFHKEVKPETATEVCSFVDNRQFLLSFYLESPQIKFKSQSFFVYAFQESGAPKGTMHFNRSIDDHSTNFVFRHPL